MVEPRVSFHSEEERHMSRKLPFEDPAKLHEASSTPSRMVRYHSENERDSSRGLSSSESGEDDVIIAEYTGTGEAIEQVGGLGQNPFNHNPYSLESKKTQLKSLRTQLKSLRTQLKSLRTQLKSLLSQLKSLRTQLKSLQRLSKSQLKVQNPYGLRGVKIAKSSRY